MPWRSPDPDPVGAEEETGAPVSVSKQDFRVCDRKLMADAMLRITLSSLTEATAWSGQVNAVLLSGWTAIHLERPE